jgi:putative SOS response-associated peptidase YedK
MCNLSASPRTRAAIIGLFRVINRYVGNLQPMPGVFPDYPAPVIRNTQSGTELATMRWGMPPPPRTGGRPWLKPENRCLVPGNSLAEYAPEPNPVTKKKDVVWFALNEDPAPVRLRWHLDDIQGGSRHYVEADPRPSPCLRLPDDGAECGYRADPSEGHGGDPNHR